MTACPITGETDCRSRDCELHYMDAPLNLGTHDAAPGTEPHAFVESGPGRQPTAIRGCIVCPACYQTASADIHRRPCGHRFTDASPCCAVRVDYLD